MLKAVFERHGPVDDVVTFPGRMYAFVNFQHADDAARAQEALDGKEVSPASATCCPNHNICILVQATAVCSTVHTFCHPLSSMLTMLQGLRKLWTARRSGLHSPACILHGLYGQHALFHAQYSICMLSHLLAGCHVVQGDCLTLLWLSFSMQFLAYTVDL